MFKVSRVVFGIVSFFIVTTSSHADAPIGMWSDTTHNSVSLGWTDSTDETAYKIYSVGNATPLVTLPAGTISYVVNDIHAVPLTPVTTYTFRITAIIDGEEVENAFHQNTISTTTHEWVNGPFKSCINSWIGIGATLTPTKNQLESLDASRMILCESQLIDDISPIGDLKYIMAISLKDNLLTMATAAPVGSLTQLGTLILADNNLSGSIPSWIGSMGNMNHLDLSNANLEGTIPSSWTTDLPLLTTLKLFGNQLTGSIPTDVGNWTGLHSLYLQDNNLSGIIPTQIGVSSLTYLHLQNNSLTGMIPSSITATNLSDLDLSNNDLSGVIPVNIDNLTNLGSIDLSRNQLSGSIPVLGVNSFPYNRIDFSNNKLTGAIPASFGSLHHQRVLHLNHNHLSGEIPSLELLSAINKGDLSMDYNCDLDTNSLSLQTYLDGAIITGYLGIVNTNGNCSTGISPALIMYLLN
jgi:Leucine-rich repeat (LRR) protein